MISPYQAHINPLAKGSSIKDDYEFLQKVGLQRAIQKGTTVDNNGRPVYDLKKMYDVVMT